MVEKTTPFAISGIRDTDKIRILIYANNEMVHAPLNAILKAGITSGNNVNGEFTRLNDGTQICWATSNSSITYNDNPSFYDWIFPAPFAKIPVVNITPLMANGQAASVFEVDNLKIRFFYNEGQSKLAVPIQAMAIGRWF